ncbi:hypothetical protein HU200_036893 [Digitaria exilis]|uniref:RING-type E3 ubiquitin transferase n=1 Tax=Digitaria exilis TaxID=1010633 RepID=A0A835BR02_9POAL|nr:hypothetical protein HU200_036893 [Digitaria exilis]
MSQFSRLKRARSITLLLLSTAGHHHHSFKLPPRPQLPTQVSESIWSMDVQSLVRAWPASTMLLCVFLVLQMLHDKTNPEAPRAMSMTMLVALFLGCVVMDLVLSHWSCFFGVIATVHDAFSCSCRIRHLVAPHHPSRAQLRCPLCSRAIRRKRFVRRGLLRPPPPFHDSIATLAATAPCLHHPTPPPCPQLPSPDRGMPTCPIIGPVAGPTYPSFRDDRPRRAVLLVLQLARGRPAAAGRTKQGRRAEGAVGVPDPTCSGEPWPWGASSTRETAARRGIDTYPGRPPRSGLRSRAHAVALWHDLASYYAELVLPCWTDSFLLPQIVVNAFSGSTRATTNAASPWFYTGVTAIRVAPHALTARSYVPSVKPSYMYAGPGDGLFGVARDVVVPCGAV